MIATSHLLSLLTARLHSGPFSIGQIAVTPAPDGRVELRHQDDAGRPGGELESFSDPYAARGIAQYDAEGEYRPLKGSPNLKTGWRLDLAGPEEVRIALDVFYPAALAVWAAESEGRLRVVPLAQTLERQTGMYRYARTISAEGADELTRRQCLTGCSRRPLWSELSVSGRRADDASALPLLCPEACSFFVAEARLVAKAEFEAKAASSPSSVT